jgi:hypothetical protein
MRNQSEANRIISVIVTWTVGKTRQSDVGVWCVGSAVASWRYGQGVITVY